MRIIVCMILMLSGLQAFSQQMVYQSWNKVATQKNGVLNAYYFNNYPFAYQDPNGKMMGVEVDILSEFSNWLMKYKGVQLEINYVKNEGFNKFYDVIRDGGNGMVGLGSVTINAERKNSVQFSQPYLKNVAVLVSALEVNSLESVKDFSVVFKDRVALVVKGSSHEKELLKIREDHYPGMQISYVSSPKEMLVKMKDDPIYYGYVDIITYWAFTKEQGGILRVHRNADLNGERFGFIFPPNSDWNDIFNEFMVGGFGFAATAEYHSILDKYLDLQVINEVQIR
ncbi:transporter substrate-binding domain-containing protein [bacterium SCSIO 12741]|nr:transporter substrate-binding domain-containing protein [bacterium SCSIO 12741]